MAEPNRPKRGKCPACGKPARVGYMPFCSARCKNLDLGRWLGGRYAIATDERPGAAGDPGADNDNLPESD